MEFRVHIRLAKNALYELKAKNMKVGRKAFVFGNIFPDLLLPHMPAHRKTTSLRFFDKQHDKLCARKRKNAKRICVWDSFLLGVLSHYAADYSCSAHMEGYDENMRAHRLHEKIQFLFLKENPYVLRETNAGTNAADIGGARVSSLIGNAKTDDPTDELVEAMDAIRLVCAGLVKA